MTPAPAPVLELSQVTAGYERSTVLRDVSLHVPVGAIVALLGPNGAGKTTLLRVAAGLIRPGRGHVRVGGEVMTAKPPHRRARAGLCLIPEGRGIFPGLSVADNLRMHTPPWITRSDREAALESALEAFPVLMRRRHQLAGTMSGGEQQMLALTRSYLSSPKIVLLDEVSMGLAPMVVDEIFAFLRRLAATGTAMLLVEQYVHRALEVADEVVLLDRGQVAFHGPADGLDRDAVVRGYLAAR